MKVSFALIGLLSAVLSPLVAESSEQVKDWSLSETKNDDGSSSKSIMTRSTNIFQGKDKSSSVELGYLCHHNFYVRTTDSDFAIDDVKCGPYGCKKIQTGQIQFDAKKPSAIDLEIWSDGKGITLLSSNEMLSKSMKRSRVAKLELEAKDTDDKQQILSFSLMGFSSAYNGCNKN